MGFFYVQTINKTKNKMGKTRKNIFDLVTNDIDPIILHEKTSLESFILKLQKVRENGADTISFWNLGNEAADFFELAVMTEKERLETDMEYEKRMYRESEDHRIRKKFVKDLEVLEKMKKEYPDLNINYNKR